MRAGYLVTRVVLVWLLTAGVLFLLSAIMPGFHVTDAGSALVTTAFIGLANALVWPTLVRIALPFTVLTQSFPFLLYPHGWQAPDEDLVGAEAVHRRFRSWVVALGHEAYR